MTPEDEQESLGSCGLDVEFWQGWFAWMWFVTGGLLAVAGWLVLQLFD